MYADGFHLPSFTVLFSKQVLKFNFVSGPAKLLNLKGLQKSETLTFIFFFLLYNERICLVGIRNSNTGPNKTDKLHILALNWLDFTQPKKQYICSVFCSNGMYFHIIGPRTENFTSVWLVLISNYYITKINYFHDMAMFNPQINASHICFRLWKNS